MRIVFHFCVQEIVILDNDEHMQLLLLYIVYPFRLDPYENHHNYDSRLDATSS